MSNKRQHPATDKEHNASGNHSGTDETRREAGLLKIQQRVGNHAQPIERTVRLVGHIDLAGAVIRPLAMQSQDQK